MSKKIVMVLPWRKPEAPKFEDLRDYHLQADVYAKAINAWTSEKSLLVSGLLLDSPQMTLETKRSGIDAERLEDELMPAMANVFNMLGIGFDAYSSSHSVKYTETENWLVSEILKEDKLKLEQSFALYCNQDQVYLSPELMSGKCTRCGSQTQGLVRCPTCGAHLEPEAISEATCLICGAQATAVQVTNTVLSEPTINGAENGSSEPVRLGFREPNGKFNASLPVKMLALCMSSALDVTRSDLNRSSFGDFEAVLFFGWEGHAVSRIVGSLKLFSSVRVFERKSLSSKPGDLLEISARTIGQLLDSDHLRALSVYSSEEDSWSRLKEVDTILQEMSRTSLKILQFGYSKYREGLQTSGGEAKADQTFADMIAQKASELKMAALNGELHTYFKGLIELGNACSVFFNQNTPWSLYNSDRKKCSQIVALAVRATHLLAQLTSPLLTHFSLWVEQSVAVDGVQNVITEPASVKWLEQPRFGYAKVDYDRLRDALEQQPDRAPIVEIDAFSKLDFRVATVMSATKVEGTRKLLRLRIKIGEEFRTIVSSIGDQYTPEELVGKKIVVFANLKPARFAGLTSRGMLLAAEGASGVSLLVPMREIEDGSKIH
ncbi:MAG: class I tRNA ligase family protein [Thermoprotei archaeon]